MYNIYYIACDTACGGCTGQKQRDCHSCRPTAYKIADTDTIIGYMCINFMPIAYYETINRIIERK